MSSQWESFLKNLGIWVGSFTKFSPTGEQLESIPSRLNIEGLNNNQAAKLTLQRHGLQDLVLEFETLSRSLLFFENGSFCQGSMQFSPVSEFGAEFCFVHQNRRLRLVQLFDTNNNLEKLTLIREYREGTELNERPKLEFGALLGKWEGKAVTMYSDLREPSIYPTKMQLEIDASGKLVQNSSFANRPPFTSSATIDGSVLNFDSNPQNPIQVLMLPDGASATFPVKAQLNQSLFLEAGWLIKADLRQRIIRSYSDKGEWVSLTLVTENKVN
ncbi:MAG: DUF3598 family protein [Methylacidiphilales bacterium]|nr:DUF3598 family protein [Candidatus Methylacidiphilales bacterium]NJR17517.1 DUF3598 family protein [Calothrix sp. CSU_2_0]